MVKILDSSVQAEKFLDTLPPFESLLLSLPMSCRTVRLFNDVVAARGRNHLLMVNMIKHRKFPDRSSVTSQLIGMNDLWDSVFTQEPRQERFRGLGITGTL